MITFIPETGSTNADLCTLAAEGLAVEGDWRVADRQGAGRGRQGRTWFDGVGNFMGSTAVVVRPGDPAPQTLALVAGLAVHGAASMRIPAPLRAELKWPNDVLVNGAKLAGVLLERAGQAVVVGIGVNLSVAPPVAGRETVALSRFGPAPSRDLFAQDLAEHFASELAAWRAAGLAPVLRRWLGVAHPLGTPLLVGEAGESALSGLFAGLDADGALLLRLADGTTRTINAGEVHLAGLT